LEPNSVLGQVECSDGTFYDLRTSVHGKLVSRERRRGGLRVTCCTRTGGSARRSSDWISDCARAVTPFFFQVEVNESLGRRAQLMVSHAAWEGFLGLFMLSPKSKSLLSVEDRRLEGSEAERDHAESTPLAPEASDADVAARNAQANADAATHLAAQELAQKEGRAWQSVIEYLTPAQYLEKRRAFFRLPASEASIDNSSNSTDNAAAAAV